MQYLILTPEPAVPTLIDSRAEAFTLHPLRGHASLFAKPPKCETMQYENGIGARKNAANKPENSPNKPETAHFRPVLAVVDWRVGADADRPDDQSRVFGAPISAGWKMSAETRVQTREIMSSLPMLAVPG